MNMKASLILLIFLVACTGNPNRMANNSQVSSNNAPVRQDTTVSDNSDDWQRGFGLTHDPATDSIWGKPVRFYIENPDCSPAARNFYWGRFRPTDDSATAALLALVTTKNEDLRPFYRWCLNLTIFIQDGALAELTGVPARRYAESFPDEFFRYMHFDTTGEKYQTWVEAILYSGFYKEDDYRQPGAIRNRMIQKMKQACINCPEPVQARITKFAADCFPTESTGINESRLPFNMDTNCTRPRAFAAIKKRLIPTAFFNAITRY